MKTGYLDVFQVILMDDQIIVSFELLKISMKIPSLSSFAQARSIRVGPFVGPIRQGHPTVPMKDWIFGLSWDESE